MSNTVITPEEIRIFLMDTPELNPLLRGIKFSPEEIDQASIHTIDYFNTIPPLTGMYTLESFPHRYLLLMGATGHLLRSASINQAINQLDYNVDGVQVNDYAKATLFSQLGTQFWQEFQQLAQNVKINQNIAAAFGSVGSEYKFRIR